MTVITIFPSNHAISTIPSITVLAISGFISSEELFPHSLFGKKIYTTRIIATRFTTFPAVVDTKENSVFRNAWSIDMMDEFTSPKSVKTHAITIPTRAGSVLYPGRKKPIPTEIAIIPSPIIDRMLKMVPAISFTFSSSSLCLLISRTLMVYSPRSAITENIER